MPGFQGYAIVSPLWSDLVKKSNHLSASKLPGGNLIIAGRNAHPIQGRKLQILEPLKGFQDQKPITLTKQVLGLAL